MEKIYRILYCSENTIQGSLDRQTAEIRKILASSRRNNGVRGITGALLFNGGYFAQVLEGPLAQVEHTFEKIQRDQRHAEVAVLEAGFVPERDFPEWTMAFAGSPRDESEMFTEFRIQQALERPDTAAEQISGLLRTLVVQEDDYALVN